MIYLTMNTHKNLGMKWLLLLPYVFNLGHVDKIDLLGNIRAVYTGQFLLYFIFLQKKNFTKTKLQKTLFNDSLYTSCIHLYYQLRYLLNLHHMTIVNHILLKLRIQ